MSGVLPVTAAPEERSPPAERSRGPAGRGLLGRGCDAALRGLVDAALARRVRTLLNRARLQAGLAPTHALGLDSLVSGQLHLAQGLPGLEPDHPDAPAHLEDSVEHYATTWEKLDDLAQFAKTGMLRRKDSTIHPQYLARLVDEMATDDAVFIPDVGSPVIYAARYLHTGGGRRIIGSFLRGSMANGVPQAVGAQSAFPGRQIVTLSGDGGITMMLSELLTVTQNRLPVKMIVFNNSSLNFVELEMKAAGFVDWGTGLANPDLAAVAGAMGIKGVHVDDAADLPAAASEVLSHDGPALLDVAVEREELTIPPSITAAQAKGFALYALRTTLSGRGDELLDLGLGQHAPTVLSREDPAPQDTEHVDCTLLAWVHVDALHSRDT